jgi:ribosomal protein L11 methyltransferase
MEKVSARTAKTSFLDLGTGTGLLAIAASHLGYQRVVAVDTDPLAAEATNRNIELNNVPNIAVLEGDISQVRGTFDVIAANLISGALIKLAPAVAAHLGPKGNAVLSGILKGQEDEVIAAMENAGLVFREKLIDGKWVSIVMARD